MAVPGSSGWQPSPDDGWPDPPTTPLNGGREERFDSEVLGVFIQRPLIVIGGFAANGLAAADRRGERCYVGQQVWPPFHFDAGSGDWSLHGVAEVNRPGLVPTALVIGQYEPLLLFLQQELGYRLDLNVFVFPYRWTDSSADTGRRLAGFIELVIQGYSWSPDQPRTVDVLSHSMGGLATRAAGLFFQAPLERVIYLACPFFGAGKGYFNLHPSHSVQLVDNMLLNRLLERLAPEGTPPWGSSTDLTQCFQKMESLYELLPDRFAFELGLSPVGVRTRLGSLPRVLTSWQEAYFEEASTAFPVSLQANVQRAMEFKEKLGLELPGRLSLTLYSASHTTVGRADLAFELSRFALFGTPYDAGGGGDGTVPAASGRGPQPALKVHGRHLSLPNHRLSFYWIARFLATTWGL